VSDLPSPSPSLEWVHAVAGLSRRFRTWLDKACKNYGDFLDFKAVVDNVLRRERLEELPSDERDKFIDALEEYDKVEEGLTKFVKLKGFVDFVSITDENLIKWVGDEIVSLGYCGFRERSSQYWLWDLKAEKLPYEHEKKVTDVFAFYGLETRLVVYGLRVPSQEQAESWLLEFLENVKKWPRDRLVWLIRNVYPLTDDTGGFWTVVRKVVEVESLRDVWEDIIEDWKSDVESALKKMPEFEVLKTVLASEWEAEKYLRGLAEDLEEEFLDKYGMVTADKERVKEEFYDRAVELLRERVAPEERLREVYEQIKPLVRLELVELTRAGLWKAIRWLFLHPTMELEAFASTHVFPLGFTTEEAREIALKIAEKVTRIVLRPPPPPIEHVKVLILQSVPQFVGADMKIYGPYSPGEIREMPKNNAEVLVKQGLVTYELVPPAPPTIRAYWGTSPRGLPALWVEVYVEGNLKVRGHLEVRRETREILERIINDKIRGSIVEAGLSEDILLVDPLLKLTTDLVKTLLETAPPEVLALPFEVVGSDHTHDMLVAEGWKPIISIPRLEEALKALGKGGHSTPELALEMAKRDYRPEVYDLKVVKHYALQGEFPYTVFVKSKVPPLPPPPERVSREEFYRAFDEALFEWIPHAIEGHKPGLAGRLHYEAPEFEAETLAKFSMDTVLTKWENVIAKEKEEVYGRYSHFAETAPEHAKRILGDVPERARHLAYSLVDKTDAQLFEEAKAKARVPPPELPTEEIERLRRVMRVKTDELGLEWSPQVWDSFWREYQARARELWATRRVSYLEEEIADVLKVVAPPPAIPKPRVVPPKEVPVAAPPEFFVEPIEVPKEPISPMPFPRSPATEERERLWRAFMYEMSRIGQDPYRWREAFRMHVLDRPYRLWGDLISNFKGFVEAVRTGREYRLLPLITLPMPWREEEEQRKYDAILHFIATKLYPSMDELVHALFTYGMEVTEDDVKKAVKRGYAEKNVWFTSVSKEDLESLVGEKL